jgi:hypothetical protein
LNVVFNLSATSRERLRCALHISILFMLGSASGTASANARILPFSYAYETLHNEHARSAIVIDADGRRAWDPRFRMQFEWGYGVSDHVELGVALVLGSAPGESVLLEGTKQRLHVRLVDQSESSPLDVGFNFEVVEFRTVLAFEQRLILQRRWGNFRVLSNTGLSEELPSYHPTVTFVVDQTIGPAVALGEHVRLAAEYWLRLGLNEHEADSAMTTAAEMTVMHTDPDIGVDTHHFVGPAITFEWHRFWWSTAAYVRLDPMHAETDVATSRRLGDPYGRLWVRSVLGLTL